MSWHFEGLVNSHCGHMQIFAVSKAAYYARREHITSAVRYAAITDGDDSLTANWHSSLNGCNMESRLIIQPPWLLANGGEPGPTREL